MMIEIKNRWTGAVLWSCEAETLRKAVEAAIRGGANLYGADLYGADLSGADLYGANLGDANLGGADLRGARNVPAGALAHYRDDIRTVLDAAPHEVGGLLQALWSGNVEGSTYQGECACLVGTIANVRGVSYDEIPGLVPNSGRPAEQWFFQIHKGDTPVTNPASAFATAIIAEWMHERAAKKTRKPRIAKASGNQEESR